MASPVCDGRVQLATVSLISIALFFGFLHFGHDRPRSHRVTDSAGWLCSLISDAFGRPGERNQHIVLMILAYYAAVLLYGNFASRNMILDAFSAI